MWLVHGVIRAALFWTDTRVILVLFRDSVTYAKGEGIVKVLLKSRGRTLPLYSSCGPPPFSLGAPCATKSAWILLASFIED